MLRRCYPCNTHNTIDNIFRVHCSHKVPMMTKLTCNNVAPTLRKKARSQRPSANAVKTAGSVVLKSVFEGPYGMVMSEMFGSHRMMFPVESCAMEMPWFQPN